MNKNGQQGVNPSDKHKTFYTQQKQVGSFSNNQQKINGNVKQGLPKDNKNLNQLE